MVSDLKGLLSNIVPHFIKYPQGDYKMDHFLIFIKCLEMISSKEVCKKQRILKVVELAYDCNMDGKRRRIKKFSFEYLRIIAS